MIQWLDQTLYAGLPYAIVTLSFAVTLQYLRFPDVTCASTFVLGGATAAFCVVRLGLDPYVALLLALFAGAIGGALTALLHLGLKIETLLAGILAAFAIYAVNLLVLHPTIPYGLGATALSVWENWDRQLTGNGSVPWHWASIGFLLVLVFAIKFSLDVFLKTELGLCVRAMEDEIAGPSVLKRYGIEPWKVKALGLTAANGLVAVAGAIVSMMEGAANVHRGFDILITGLIAYLIGSKFREWLPVLYKHRGGPSLGKAWQPSFTTCAIIGPLVYFGLITLANRTHIPASLMKLLISVYVAITIGDKSGLYRLLATMRERNARGHDPTNAMQDVQTASRLTVSDMSYAYTNGREHLVLDGISFEARASELVLLSGSNGSGKSTIMKLIAGIIGNPQAGCICLSDRVLTFDAGARQRLCAYIEQDPRRGLVETLSVEENFALANLGMHPSAVRFALTKTRRQYLRDVASKGDVEESLMSALPTQMSGGQRQLANLLTVWSRPELPHFAFLDEPLNNLDAYHIRRCIRLIRELAALVVPVIFDAT